MSTPLLVFLFLSAVWGSTWLFIKLGLADLPPFTFAGIRFVIAVLPLLVVLAVRRPRLPRRAADWWLMIWTGILTFTVAYGLVFWGEQHVSSGLTSILYTTMPLFGLVLAHFSVQGESMTFRKLGGVLLGIVGVVLVFSRELVSDDPLAIWGSLGILGSSFVSALAGVAVKRRAGHLDLSLFTTVQMLAGLVLLLAIGIPLEGSPLSFRWTPMAVASLLYLAFVGSALPFVLYYWLIRRIPVTQVQLIPLVSTLIAVLLGAVVLGERLGWWTALGAAGVLVGLVLATLPRAEK